MKGTLISAEVNQFHRLTDEPTLAWNLVIKTRWLKRKVKLFREIHASVDVRSFIGKRIEI